MPANWQPGMQDVQRLAECVNENHAKDQERVEAEAHFKFVCELYKLQHEAGRKFLHEHRVGATSWPVRCIGKVKPLEGVKITGADLCMYGLKTWSTHRGIKDTPAQKRTICMTNSEAIATRLGKQ